LHFEKYELYKRDSLLDDYAEQDEDFKYVYDEWKSFIKVTRSWSKQNEMPSEFFLDF